MGRRSKKAVALLQAMIERGATEVSFHGTRAAERFGDDELALLRELPSLGKCTLLRQEVTRLPVLAPSVCEIWIGDCPTLAALDGIEELASLNKLWLTNLPALDFERAFELLVELPELVELRIGGGLARLPSATARLASAATVVIECTALDLADATMTLGRLTTLHSLTFRGGGNRPFPDVLAPLVQVERLGLHGYATLPRSVGEMAALETLDLTGSYVRELPPEIGKLTRLKKLLVPRSPLSGFPDELCDCVALELIDVSDGNLSALPDNIGRLVALESLDLLDSPIKELPDSIGDLANLRVVRLPDKRLTVPESFYKLSLESFMGPDEVRQRITLRPPPTPEQDRVHISGSLIPDSFGDPRELTVSLHERTEPLPQLSALRRLTAATLDVGNLADALARLATAAHLRTLAITGIREQLPDELCELVRLTSLVIDSHDPGFPDSRGALLALPATIGRLVNLEQLRLGTHGMTQLPPAIGDLAALEALDLELVDIATLPSTIGKLRSLETLVLRSPGALSRLPEELVQCSALATVDLRGWFGTELALDNLELLGELPALRKVSLWRVAIPRPAAVLRALARAPIECLVLTDPALVELPATIGELAQLRTLELDGTSITGLPPELRGCAELRWISVPIHSFIDRDVKPMLPRGRWKKHFRTHVTWFERTD